MLDIKTEQIRNLFKSKLLNEKFSIDKTGQKTIEVIGASFLADEPSIFGTPNDDYINHEILWYQSHSCNINDIYSDEREPPKAWQLSANKYGEINSNYGCLISSDKYYGQYGMALDELLRNKDSRRASMIYQRPSIWVEYEEDGKNDFICTNAVTYYIRNDELHAVVQMRSNDVVFGYKNDYAWQLHVLEELVHDYNSCKTDTYEEIKPGDIIWQVQNLHVYERHFHLVK
ncbi:MAG: dCMP hydroxymethylase [Euryarchaeota archaeon]|jgi:thymidylate synthase|nr:dCMP hydroxymethylase [Euryarchaeota archaeon]